MKELSKKTGVPEEHLKSLMNQGIISCSWAGYEEIYYHYKSIRSDHPSMNSAVIQTSVDKNIPRSTVYEIIHKFE